MIALPRTSDEVTTTSAAMDAATKAAAAMDAATNSGLAALANAPASATAAVEPMTAAT